jgi:hypothetical protein
MDVGLSYAFGGSRQHDVGLLRTRPSTMISTGA